MADNKVYIVWCDTATRDYLSKWTEFLSAVCADENAARLYMKKSHNNICEELKQHGYDIHEQNCLDDDKNPFSYIKALKDEDTAMWPEKLYFHFRMQEKELLK